VRPLPPIDRFTDRYQPAKLRASAGVVGDVGTCGAEGASSSLEEGSLKNHPRYDCILKDFGEGHVVCTGVFFEGPRCKVSSENAPVEIVREMPEYFQAERDVANIRRAKRTVRERIWMLRGDRMLTLTRRGKFETVDDAWAAWKKFCNLARKLWGERWQFVVVPEAHKEGGFHLHVALKGYFDAGMARRMWYRALGGTGRESGSETPGNIDFTQARTGARSRTRIANYLAKYLGKELGAVFRGRRAFATSRGIPSPRVVRWSQAVHIGASAIGIAMRRVRGVVPERLEGLGWWEFQVGGFHGFVISPL
jgi:hypothetical protein